VCGKDTVFLVTLAKAGGHKKPGFPHQVWERQKKVSGKTKGGFGKTKRGAGKTKGGFSLYKKGPEKPGPPFCFFKL